MEKAIEEKIDYIYETLKKQESRYKRALWSKWIFRILMIWYLYYSFVYLLPGYIENLKEMMTPNITKSVSESINNIDKDELINKFKSIIKK